MIKNFKKLLSEFVDIPSISADSAWEKDINRAAKWLVRYAKDSSLQVQIVTGYDNPIIIARTKNDPSKKTILVYGHYDVQPASCVDGWKTDPFVLTERSGRLYGRGVADNKGQILMHLYTVTQLLKEEKLRYNVIFLIEGNEETGSSRFADFLRDYRKALVCDGIIISDGDLAKGNAPAFEVSFRGVANIEIDLRVAPEDVHSGLFGGLVPNAAEVLSQLIAKFSDKEKEIFGSTGHSIEVTTITSGYQGVGFRNSVPAQAMCRINIRSAGDSDPDKLVKDFEKFLRKNISSFAKLKIRTDKSARGAFLSLDNPFAERARRVLKSVYKKQVIEVHCGATLPIIGDFKSILKAPVVCVPLANEDCGMHSAAENILVKSIERGLAFSQSFFAKDN